MSRDQLLFYGGALLAVIALVWLIAMGVHYWIASRRLRSRLDEEYGEQIR